MFKIFGISLCLMISLVSIDEGVAQSSDRAGPSFSPWFDPEFPPRTREAQAAKPFKIHKFTYGFTSRLEQVQLRKIRAFRC